MKPNSGIKEYLSAEEATLKLKDIIAKFFDSSKEKKEMKDFLAEPLKSVSKVWQINASAGIGKTTQVIKQLKTLQGWNVVYYMLPNRKMVADVAADMIKEGIWREIGKHRTSISIGELAAFKKIFGVSIQAITYRCKDLGVFNQALFGKLCHFFTKSGWRKAPYAEPESIPPEFETPERFKRLCFRAYAEKAISKEQVNIFLNLRDGDLNSELQKLY